MIIRFAEKNWRPDDKTLINTGFYWIPRDMSEELARRALAEGVAVLVEDDALEVEHDDEASKPGNGGDGSGESNSGLGGPGTARRGRPRKGPAPENKAR